MSDNLDNRSLWRQATAAGAALSACLSPTLRHYSSETGLSGWTWFMLLRVYSFAPKAVTVDGFRKYGTYSGDERFQPHFTEGVEQGYLQQEKGDSYRLTEFGQAAVAQFITDLRAVMVAYDPLSAEDGEQLAELLDRLVQTSRDTLPPDSLKSIELSYTLMPDRTPPLPYSEQAISCLAAYRDDVHVAAWRPSGLSGPAVEALTLLWRGQADSLESLQQRLLRRGHPPQVYPDVLVELRGRGFIDGADDALLVTEAGRVYRQQVEDETDRYFFLPWSCLNPDEKRLLSDLLTCLREGLQSEDHEPAL